MAEPPPARIHPTALISTEAKLADDVRVGPYAILEGPVELGPGCVVRPHAHLIGPLTMGRHNVVHTGAVIGDRPQHSRYNDEATRVEIGDHNIFRENVTIHRGTSQSWATIIGSHNFVMANAHIAHDCRIGDRCILANGALVAGHCVVDDGVFLSGNSAVHQFARVGRLAMLSGCSISAKDMPPFVIQQGINCIVGVNVVGMHRAGLSHAQINGVRAAYRILFFEGKTLPGAMAEVEQAFGAVDTVMELLTFLRKAGRGVSSARERGREAA